MGSLSINANGNSLSKSPSATCFNLGTQRNQDVNLTNLVTRRRSGTLFRALASTSKRNSKDNIIMVDPLEAKRLAAQQMKEIHSQEKLKRQRQIEAINGAWAVIGLTAGLVIEGYTGNDIVGQLTGYWSAITSLFHFLCQ